MITKELLGAFEKIFDRNGLFTDPVDCYAYAYDNARRISTPHAVVFATNANQVCEAARLCNEYRVPLTPRGRGTGTAGGSVPAQGGIVLSLERMRRIIAVDPANRAMIVEPGVLNREAQEAAAPHSLFWPPDPSSADYSSVGGNLATCAAGPHAVKYGVARDHVLGLRAVTAEGKLIRTGCYTSKGVVGYDLTRLLIGSEGTLAIIVEATLKLSPLPAATGGITAHYADAPSCARTISAIMAQPCVPSALEFLDEGSLNLIRPRVPLPAQSRAMLMIEVDGSEQEIAEKSTAILAQCENSGLLEASRVDNSQLLWRARKALSPLLRDIAPKKINEDVVVPVARLAEFLAGLSQLARKHQVTNVNFGHAGNGNLHVNLLVDAHDARELARAHACLGEIFDLVIALDGTLSGEHGIGIEKRDFVPREVDSATLEVMRSVKRAFDPNGILNPGKIFPRERV